MTVSPWYRAFSTLQQGADICTNFCMLCRSVCERMRCSGSVAWWWIQLARKRSDGFSVVVWGKLASAPRPLGLGAQMCLSTELKMLS